MPKLYDRHTREFRLEISGDSLRGLDLRSYDLHCLDLGGQDCSGCIFDGMNLEEIELSDANLSEASFKGSFLTEAVLTGVNGYRAKFNNVILSMTTLAGSKLTEADFSECIFEGVVNFTGISAVGAKFRNIKKLGDPNFWKADLRNVDFEGTDMNAVSPGSMAGANLEGTLFAHLATGGNMVSENEENAENILCKNHRNEPRLATPVLIACIICSQPGDPNTKRDSFYAHARLCSNCAINTAICAICEESLDDII